MLMDGCERGLAVSLPGSALRDLRLPGSVFDPQELGAMVLPPDLRLAVNLLLRAAEASQLPLRFIARPEIFTHGALVEGLVNQLQGIGDHLALSDGGSCRLVPGLRNHLFFYRRHEPDAVAQMRALVGIAPESIGSLASQVNSTIAFRADGRWQRPPTRLLRFAETPRLEPARLLPFYCHPGNPELSAAASLGAPALEEEEVDALGPDLLYVPLAPGILADAVFMRWLAERLAAAMLRQRHVVLELPAAAEDPAEIAEQIGAVTQALSPLGVVFPRVLSRSVLWATGAPSPDLAARARIVVHPALDFWRLGEDIWQVAEEVLVVQDGAAAAFTRLMRDWLGDLAAVSVLRPQLRPHQVRVAAVL